jgi:hypothetical protein
MILACDPGLRGAFALLDGARIQIHDMPVVTRAVGSPMRDRDFIDERGVFAQIEQAVLLGATRLVVEQVNGVAGQSAPAAFQFGYGFGIVIAAAIAHRLEIERVTAGVWKKALRVPSDKRASRGRASELLPHHADLWRLQKHDGRAEAAMIALYAQRHLKGSS